MSLRPYVHLDHPLAGSTAGTRVPLDGEARHHLTTVLRLTRGARLEVADGRGAVASGRLDSDEVELLTAPVVTPPARPRLELAQALAKGRRFDEVVRQATELGVDVIRPVAAERSVSKLSDERAERARARWSSVARAAAEQARRPTRPRLAPPCPVDGLDLVAAEVLVAQPGAPALPDVAGDGQDVERVVLVVGPEGGWSDAELETLLEQGGRLAGLGPTVLRTEHAGAAGLAVLAARFGRWAHSS